MMAYAAFPAASESGGMVIAVSAVSAQDGSVPDLTCDVVLCDQSARACQSYDWSPSAQRCSIGCGGENVDGSCGGEREKFLGMTRRLIRA